VVKGADDILVRFGKCCQPVPGDKIVGYITRGFGVTVHRAGCVNAVKTNPERLIEVEWDAATRESFPVKVKIGAMDRVGLLADLASCMSKGSANILSANTQTNESKIVTCYFTLEVANTEQLGQLVASLKKIKNVLEVERVG
ncbi:MAG: bifunctional (p)ppGpp synthetase/guanosine-3',5'-bis(diphosphate) 3'-pyrophosphohydrolase, partial [Desulfatitalea sp.]|nr:bifunctional (p)ppGpp synthetase/guanosine-3',5'-bis(diphosphate) 3'-pyrophosphohydrolase [Desulfatitalea sp.]